MGVLDKFLDIMRLTDEDDYEDDELKERVVFQGHAVLWVLCDTHQTVDERK